MNIYFRNIGLKWKYIFKHNFRVQGNIVLLNKNFLIILFENPTFGYAFETVQADAVEAICVQSWL